VKKCPSTMAFNFCLNWLYIELNSDDRPVSWKWTFYRSYAVHVAKLTTSKQWSEKRAKSPECQETVWGFGKLAHIEVKLWNCCGKNTLYQGWANFFYGGPHWKFYCYRGAAYIFCLLKLQFTTYEVYELVIITMCLSPEFTYNMTTECN